MRNRSQTLGYLRVGAGAAIWGSISLLVRALDLPVPVMVFYRFIFALIAAFLVMVFLRASFKIKNRKNRNLLLLSGLFLSLNWFFFFYALILTTVASAVLVTYTAPILVALFAPLFLRERLEFNTVISLALSMSGILLILAPALGGSGPSLGGITFALLTSLTYAALVIIGKELLPHLSVLTIIFYQSLIAMVALSPAAFSAAVPQGLRTWSLLVIMGVVHTFVAPYLYLSGLRVVKAQRAGIFTYFDPLTATVLAAVFLGEIPGLLTVAGGLLIVAGGYNVVRASEQ